MAIPKRPIVLAICSVLAFLAKGVPFGFRRGIIRLFLLTESRIGTPNEALKRLFAVEDDLTLLENERATAYGNGAHPKHQLTGYHEFFIAQIPKEGRVLDIGCGIGAVARSIALSRPGVNVLGMDSDPAKLAQARVMSSSSNLAFVEGDATKFIPEGPWNAVVLSNVLEHITDRVFFLKTVMQNARPDMLLLRVPLFERHWSMALRKKMGVDFRSDPTHSIEHSLEEFTNEIKAAGLHLRICTTLWGEIWAVADMGNEDRNRI